MFCTPLVLCFHNAVLLRCYAPPMLFQCRAPPLRLMPVRVGVSLGTCRCVSVVMVKRGEVGRSENSGVWAGFIDALALSFGLCCWFRRCT